MKNFFKKIHTKAYRIFLELVGFSNDKTSRNLFKLFRFATYSTIIIFITNIFSLFSDNTSFGSFGDYFGGMLNPILTFFTFMGLLITIVLQQKELRLTRNEMQTSTKALENQATTQEKQRFENTFFSLLELHNQILMKICDTNHNKWTDAESDIDYIHKKCLVDETYSIKQAKAKLLELNELVGHLYRTTYQLLKLIATKHPGCQIGLDCPEELLRKAPVSNEEKFYSNLVRAVLSYKVTQLLAINCYSENDSFSKFKALIVRYEFLEHMPLKTHTHGQYKTALIESINHFGEDAFGKSQFLQEFKTRVKI